MWDYCRCKPTRTNHRVKFLSGEKEAYYEITCNECGRRRLLTKGEYRELKEMIESG